MTPGSCIAIQKSVNLLRVYSPFFTTPPIQSTPLLRYDTPRIQPPLIRSRYYVRNAKRVVASLHVSHVVVGANKRQLYSQAGAITSEKQILMVLNESFSVAKSVYIFFTGTESRRMHPPWASSNASFKQRAQLKAHAWGRNVTERYPGVRPFATIRKTNYLKHHGEEVTLLVSVTHIKSSLGLQFHCFDIVNLLQYINHSAFLFHKYLYQILSFQHVISIRIKLQLKINSSGKEVPS